MPFEERTVKSNEEIEALQRLSGQTSLPLLTIGSQQLKGYGGRRVVAVPRRGRLPQEQQPARGLPQRAGPRPLMALQPARPRAACGCCTVAAQRNPRPGPPSAGRNPAGIKF
jgi:hypothetical protein